MRTIYSLFAASFFLSINTVCAQDMMMGNNFVPTVFSPSPNASSLGVYGQIPVNLFNGMPNININLYNLKVDNYELPITLSYHLASVKPEERPGWVGLGWNLSAGGAITRNIVDRADEVLTLYSGQTPNIPNLFSYYDHSDVLNFNGWNSSPSLHAFASCLSQVPQGCASPAPDEFSFNVNGLSGTFFKNHEGKWVVEANQNIDIKIDDELMSDFKLKDPGYPNNPHSGETFRIKRIIYGFTLKTNDGTQYVFGKHPNALEFSAPVYTTATDNYRTNFVVKTWYLTKIILPSNKEIVFTYTNSLGMDPEEYPPTSLYHTVNRAVFKQYINTSSMSKNGFWTNERDDKILERQFVVYLSKITTENAEVNFLSGLTNDLEYNWTTPPSPWGQYETGTEYPINSNLNGNYTATRHWFKLDQIAVTNQNKQIYKANFKFENIPSKRLFLTGLEESGNVDCPIIKRHFFEYNTLPLPNYNAKKIDHWGYFNNGFGTTSPSGMPPYYQTRQPNPAYMQAGTLTRIEFPTGGYTEFEYAPHDFSSIIEQTFPSANQATYGLVTPPGGYEVAGGLRIKKIKSDPLNSGTPIIKEYFYVKDYHGGNMSSSGILSGRPFYHESGFSNDGWHFTKMSSNSFKALNNSGGSHITYTTVTEKLSDGSLTEYTYSNHDNGYIDHPAWGYVFNVPSLYAQSISTNLPYRSRSYARGNLLIEKKYNSNGGLVEKTTNTYNDSMNENDAVRAIYFSRDFYGTVETDGVFTLITPPDAWIAKSCSYSRYTHHFYLQSTERIVYDPITTKSVTSLTQYEYNNLAGRHQLKKKSFKYTDSKFIHTKYFYAEDTEMTSPLQPVLSDLIAKNMTGIPLQTQVFRDTELISQETKKYNTFPSGDPFRPLVLPEFIYNKKGNESTNLEEKRISFKYDDRGNIIEYTVEHGRPVSIIWGYNKTLPVVKIENMDFAILPSNLVIAVQTASNEASLLMAINNLRDDTSTANALITGYTYYPLIGISTITDPKGIKSTYTYDDFGRLKWVKDQDGNIVSENLYHYKNQ